MRILGNYALVLLLQGKGLYRDARGREARLKSGDFIHVFPDLPHAYGPGAGETWDEVYIVFDGPIFSTLRQYGLLSANRPIGHVKSVEDSYEELKALLHPDRRGSPGSEPAAVGRFVSLLFRLTAVEGAGTPRAGMDQPISDAMEWLSGPSDGRWLSPADVAARVGLSPETFRKRFTRSVGLPPARFQKQKKIERACAALYQGPPSLKQLASDLGYFDEFHFSKAFKQVVGQPPSAYRRRLAGE